MRHDFMKMLAAMTTLLIAVAIAAPIAAENVYPECPLRRSAEVSFRTPGSHDVLEISIGAGPCYKATLTLVIRAEAAKFSTAMCKDSNSIQWSVGTSPISTKWRRKLSTG
jgi:hypothetical protein